MTSTTTMRILAAGGLLFLAAQVSAQTLPESPKKVFRCTVSGKTVYQPAPCNDGGKTLNIAPGPTDEDAANARNRAEADRTRLATSTATLPAAGGKSAVNCDSLNRSRLDAASQRDKAPKGKRKQQALANVKELDSRYEKSGCVPPA